MGTETAEYAQDGFSNRRRRHVTPHKARVIRGGLMSARIALLRRFHVTAQGRRAAIANGFESFFRWGQVHVPIWLSFSLNRRV